MASVSSWVVDLVMSLGALSMRPLCAQDAVVIEEVKVGVLMGAVGTGDGLGVVSQVGLGEVEARWARSCMWAKASVGWSLVSLLLMAT